MIIIDKPKVMNKNLVLLIFDAHQFRLNIDALYNATEHGYYIIILFSSLTAKFDKAIFKVFKQKLKEKIDDYC